MRAFPERVALDALPTELGDVKTCLYACHNDVLSRIAAPDKVDLQKQ
jgi:hypothetical protein